jgi:hypothetical protein
MGSPLKTFVVGTNASGANNGEFIINDLGQNTGGAGARRMTITNAGEAHFTGAVQAPSFVQASSLRFKENVQGLLGALETVNRLQGVSFDWKESGETSIGLIAEQVAGVIPEAVKFDEDNRASGVNYAALVGVLVEAVKSQQREIGAQHEEMQFLRREIEMLKAEMNSSSDRQAGESPPTKLSKKASRK